MQLKSYTDIEQSKKLAEILPLKSADMRFCFSHNLGGRTFGHYPMIGREPSMGTIPCWSLAALLGVIPEPNLVQNPEKTWLIRSWINSYPQSVGGYSNPVDACYEMITRLHEKNLL